MASNFQSSFIPKGSTTEEVFKNKKTGIAGILAVSLFVVSIVHPRRKGSYRTELESSLAAAEIFNKSTSKKFLKKIQTL